MKTISQNTNAPKLLLVDDEPRILRSLKAALKNKYQIQTATNGLDAKTILNNNHDFAAIISDEKMPELPGHELLIWSKRKFPNIARILITGNFDLNTIQKSINEAEIFQYVTKPWSLNDFTQTIDKAITQVKPQRTPTSPPKAAVIRFELAIFSMVRNNEKTYRNACQSIKQKPLIFKTLQSLQRGLEDNPNIGVLFIDDDHVNDMLIKMVIFIHQQHPNLVIIITTHASEGKGAITLLNEGQIFRYLVKPLTETRLVPMLKAAFKKCQKNQSHTHQPQIETTDSSLKKYWQKMSSLWH